MKKLVTAACALAASMAMAQVQSANTVGFIEQEFDDDLGGINVGVCFSVVGDSSASFTIADSAFGKNLIAWDQFYAFDAENWDLTCYTYKGAGKGWDVVYADADIDPEVVASLSIAPGTSLYYLGANESFTTAGEVAASGTQSITFDTEEAGAFDFVNPFPVATTFGDLETFARAWDQFYLFDPANWDLTCYTYKGAGKGWDVVYADPDIDPEVISDSTATFLEAGQSATFLPGATVTWNKTLNY